MGLSRIIKHLVGQRGQIIPCDATDNGVVREEIKKLLDKFQKTRL
jgi:hypothetical protein